MTLSGYKYVCSAGETFDSAARGLYGNEKYAAELLCANPEQAGTLRFAGGETLLLPIVDTAEARPDKAPWRD